MNGVCSKLASVAGAEFSGGPGAPPACRAMPSRLNVSWKHWPARITRWSRPACLNGRMARTRDRYAFGHILYQNVVYQHLAPGQRAQTHQASGQAAGTSLWRPHLGNRAGAGASFRAGPGFSERLALPRDRRQRALRSALVTREAASYLTRGAGYSRSLRARPDAVQAAHRAVAAS